MSKLATVDPKQITIGGFTFTETGVSVNGAPSFGDYQGASDFATRAVKASSWWIADLLRYADTRDDWRAKLEAVMDHTELAEETVKNLKWVGEKVPPARRRADVAFSLHTEVAPLSGPEQTEWLEQAAEKGWTQRELRHAIKVASRTVVLKGGADNCYTVDVTVRIELNAPAPYTPFAAQEAAWARIKAAVASEPHAHVIGAHALPGVK